MGPLGASILADRGHEKNTSRCKLTESRKKGTRVLALWIMLAQAFIFHAIGERLQSKL
jgi:hypothetical protein